jgi:hypothetical protein
MKNAKDGITQTALQVARPTTAFIVVDVQNDFISGSLAISNCPAGQNGEDVSKTSSYTVSTLKIVTGYFGVVFVAFIDIIRTEGYAFDRKQINGGNRIVTKKIFS